MPVSPPTHESWFNDFAAKLKNALDNLVTLETVTAVGPVECQFDEKTDAGPKGPSFRLRPTAKSLQECTSMYSKIDLLQGDVTTCIPEKFVTGGDSYSELRQFHLEREKEGRKIINDNIAALKELMGAATKAFSELKPKTPA